MGDTAPTRSPTILPATSKRGGASHLADPRQPHEDTARGAGGRSPPRLGMTQPRDPPRGTARDMRSEGGRAIPMDRLARPAYTQSKRRGSSDRRRSTKQCRNIVGSRTPWGRGDPRITGGERAEKPAQGFRVFRSAWVAIVHEARPNVPSDCTAAGNQAATRSSAGSSNAAHSICRARRPPSRTEANREWAGSAGGG